MRTLKSFKGVNTYAGIFIFQRGVFIYLSIGRQKGERGCFVLYEVESDCRGDLYLQYLPIYTVLYLQNQNQNRHWTMPLSINGLHHHLPLRVRIGRWNAESEVTREKLSDLTKYSTVNNCKWIVVAVNYSTLLLLYHRSDHHQIENVSQMLSKI